MNGEKVAITVTQKSLDSREKQTRKEDTVSMDHEKMVKTIILSSIATEVEVMRGMVAGIEDGAKDLIIIEIEIGNETDRLIIEVVLVEVIPLTDGGEADVVKCGFSDTLFLF